MLEMLPSFEVSRVHSVLEPERELIVIQINPFAVSFIGEGRIMDNFEFAVYFNTLFDISCFNCYYIA